MCAGGLATSTLLSVQRTSSLDADKTVKEKRTAKESKEDWILYVIYCEVKVFV